MSLVQPFVRSPRLGAIRPAAPPAVPIPMRAVSRAPLRRNLAVLGKSLHHAGADTGGAQHTGFHHGHEECE